MAKNPNIQPERFAYDFEMPVVEVEKEIQDLRERAEADEMNLDAEIAVLERKRDRLLKDIHKQLTAYQRVRLARHPLRPHPMDFIRAICTDVYELHGDRRFGDDRAICTGLGTLDGRRILFVCIYKGKETREKMAANFGMPHPEGYRKALLKMQLAEKFGLPVVCLIDTPGAAPGVGAEERGQGMAIAENIFVMAGLRVPVVVVVTGEGCSGGALGIGVGDRFAMLENAYYSVITPEGCAAILWKDGSLAAEAAEAMKLTAQDMLQAGIIDTIIDEPLGGAHHDPAATTDALKAYLGRTLGELQGRECEQLLEERYARYRRIGVFEEPQPAPAAPPGQSRPEGAPSDPF
jgi:acetyl-CoA carboxylase carboxyl transferase subunit alpha